MKGSAVRAWLVAHDALPVGAALTVLTCVLAVRATSLIPVPGETTPLPVWQLTPAAYAMLAAVTVANGLPTFSRSLRVRAARALWLALVLTATMLGAAVVDQATRLPSLVPVTGVLVLLTFGASAVVGRSAVWVGGGCVVWIMLHVQDFASTATPWALTTSAARAAVVLGLAGSVAGYVLRGGTPLWR